MGLLDKQKLFSQMVALLLLKAADYGYHVTFGDAWARDGHKEGSFHYKRLAIDLNLFKDNKYLTETRDHILLGTYWKKLGGTWGGDFEEKDGNHYSLGEK